MLGYTFSHTARTANMPFGNKIPLMVNEYFRSLHKTVLESSGHIVVPRNLSLLQLKGSYTRFRTVWMVMFDKKK
jgi:hypothetical protein